MRWTMAAVVGVLLVFGAVPNSVGAEEEFAGLRVVVDPPAVITEVGRDTVLTITVTNEGPDAVGPLSVHIDITDPARSSSIDPEDWSDALTQGIGTLAAGETFTLRWTIKPISGGDFNFYAVVLARDTGPSLAASNAVELQVAERRSLNPEGILPVAIVMPLAVGLLLAVRQRWTNRSGGSTEPDTP